ncbi:GatB YqeY domain-containing protein [Mycena filopes]|nr:GatB YqeY domain-containing protein [Mycena filopes]
MAALRWLRRPALQLYRSYSVSVESASALDVRAQLAAAVKQAMKAKDSQRSTTLRTVLAEIYSADKAAHEQVNSSAIMTILKKATSRRAEAATQFTAAARPELAEKELAEAAILSQFLPPSLSEAEVDDALRKILFEDGERNLGQVFKLFYRVVDKSRVDADMVKNRMNVLLSETK